MLTWCSGRCGGSCGSGPRSPDLLNADRWDDIAKRLEADPSTPIGTRVSRVAGDLLHSQPIGLLAVAGDGTAPVPGGDADGEVLDEAQILLGEGPTVDATTSTAPVLADDLAGPLALLRWPGFVARASEADVTAAFAFPMHIGGVRVGVLTAYREQPGPLSPSEFADGLVISSLATLLLMESGQVIAGEISTLVGNDLAGHSRLQIAAGMVAEQLDVSVADALARLRAHAYATDGRLDDVTRAVIARTLELEP